MKRKYYALLAVLLPVLSLAAVALDAFCSQGKGGGVRRSLDSKAMPDVYPPSRAVVKEMERLETQLADLAHPPDSDVFGVNLALFGYHPRGRFRHAYAGSNARFTPDMDYFLSLAFSAKGKGFCVIDGVFFKQGSVLPDGARIITIESDRVLVNKDGFECWISVNKEHG